MMRDAVLFDLSQFLADPLRTGVQRVVFEIIRHWSGPPLAPIAIDADGKCRLLPSRTISLLEEFFAARPGAGDARKQLVKIGQFQGTRLRSAAMTQARALLNAEVFYSAARIAFYEKLLRRGWADRLFFLVYDMLPWLHPNWFPTSNLRATLGFVRLLLQVKNLAFISPRSQADFSFRIRRNDRLVGRVLPLGSDGLGVAPAVFVPGRKRFAVVGTLEPRKNIEAVLDAFESLWRDGIDAELVLAGRMLSLSAAMQQRIAHLQQHQPRFRWESGLTDQGVQQLIRGCRATVFVSLGEGFGLPPLESLALGVPVIVSAHTPSLDLIEPHGQVRLTRPGAEEIRAAVVALLDDRQAKARYDEVPLLRLPRWRDLGGECAQWVQGVA